MATEVSRAIDEAVLAALAGTPLAAPEFSGLCVAFSGGRDSTVLLHALAEHAVNIPLRAVHVHHGLHPDADHWAEHCAETASALGIALDVRPVQLAGPSANLEARARAARYAELRSACKTGEWVVTAHHRRDQAESFLLAALRGSGPDGLAAMPVFGEQHGVPLLRPLLDVSAEAIAAYAASGSLRFIEDSANADTRFDRNYLRHRVAPLLRARWPGIDRVLSRSARLGALATEVLDEIAAEDVAGWKQGTGFPVEKLEGISAARRRNALRFLLAEQGLAIPSEAQLLNALDVLLSARPDAVPLAAWPGVRIRRYRGALWFYSDANDPGGFPDGISAHRWYPADATLDLGRVRGRLAFVPARQRGIAPDWVRDGVEVRFREGGERLRTAPGRPRRTLKNLLQEEEVLPWMRRHIPLIYSGDTLLAAGDLWVNADCLAPPSQKGLEVAWRDHLPVCGARPR